MQTQLQLDYPAILAGTAQPVHLCLTFTAPEITSARPQPVAFAAVIDRSGSMEGPPLAAARRAAVEVVRNLRPGDFFGLVVFDDCAETRIPLGPVTDRAAAIAAINGIASGGSTNLAGGWSLGRQELEAAPAGTPRKLLLLTDGELNVGIIDPALVRQLAAAGCESQGVRTSCLGFGDHYNSELLDAMASVSGGALHDASQADNLPEIFRKELDGLQQIAVQNVRVEIRPAGFVEHVRHLGDCPELQLPGTARRYAVGDLVSGEQRRVLFALDVLPIPAGADGRPVADWDGELLADLVLTYDLITERGLETRTETHHVKVRPVQSAADVQVNAEILPWVSLQSATKAVDAALAAGIAGRVDEARQIIRDALARLVGAPDSDLLNDARRLLEKTRASLEDDPNFNRNSRDLRSMKHHFMRMSSFNNMAVSEENLPSFKRPRRAPSATPPPDATPPAAGNGQP